MRARTRARDLFQFYLHILFLDSPKRHTGRCACKTTSQNVSFKTSDISAKTSDISAKTSDIFPKTSDIFAKTRHFFPPRILSLFLGGRGTALLRQFNITQKYITAIKGHYSRKPNRHKVLLFFCLKIVSTKTPIEDYFSCICY